MEKSNIPTVRQNLRENFAVIPAHYGFHIRASRREESLKKGRVYFSFCGFDCQRRGLL